MKEMTLLAAFICLILQFGAAQADEAAASKYQACVACHGETAQGKVGLGAPALAGQQVAYLQRQLQHFKSGVRGADPRDTLGAQMTAIAQDLSEEDIVVVTEYLAGLPAVVPKPVIGGDLKNGNNYYQATCGACHGGQAQGNPGLNAPALTMLDATYLRAQYRNFQQGLRGTHPDDKYGRQMKMMSTSLPSDKDLDDVIAYIQSLNAPQ